VPVNAPRGERGERGRSARSAKAKAPPLPLDAAGLERFAALKAWRAEVARDHNLPAFVVFHDAALAQMAHDRPDSLEALSGINGVGSAKLASYGSDILRVLQSAG
jgi:ATP-dependent DNA helicase RecQ